MYLIHRLCRPGSIVGPQQQYLESIEARMLKEGAEYRLRHRLPAPAYASASDEVSVYVVWRFLCALLCAVARIVVMLFVASVQLHLLLLTYKRHTCGVVSVTYVLHRTVAVLFMYLHVAL
jgi:hypothetical protein